MIGICYLMQIRQSPGCCPQSQISPTLWSKAGLIHGRHLPESCLHHTHRLSKALCGCFCPLSSQTGGQRRAREKGIPTEKAGGKGCNRVPGPYRGWSLPRVEERSLLSTHSESVEATGGRTPRETVQPLSRVGLCLMKLAWCKRLFGRSRNDQRRNPAPRHEIRSIQKRV